MCQPWFYPRLVAYDYFWLSERAQREEEAVAIGKKRIQPNYRRRVLRLPDLDHCKTAVLNSLGSPASRRVSKYAIDQFIAWYCSEPRRKQKKKP